MWKQDVSRLEGELQSHPYHWQSLQYTNKDSSYNYRHSRESEIRRLKMQIKKEENRQIKVDHSIQNAQLASQGAAMIDTDRTGWQKFAGGLDDLANVAMAPITKPIQALTPAFDRGLDSIDNVVDRTGDVIEGGQEAFASILGNPIVWIAGAAAAVFILPKVLKI